MRALYSIILFAATLLAFQASIVHAADVENMKSACRARAAKAMGVSVDAVEVKYEGQRTDKTHAVNGSALVDGQTKTFQCSFAPNGRKISKFIVNSPKPMAKANAKVNEEKEADASMRAGSGDFDATGRVPCAEHKGQPMAQCKFGVARDPGGSATVVVTRPDGRTRAIFFEKGKAISADLSQADGNMTFRATKEGDLYKIQAGNERYEIPEVVVFGD